MVGAGWGARWGAGWGGAWRARGVFNQALMVLLINVPTISFGLALGWVSLASGEAGGEADGAADGAADSAASGAASDAAGRSAVVAAVTTFVASLAGVPLSARALAAGRKLAIIVTSAAFVVCWSLKLAGVYGGGAWCIVAARVAAGLGGAAAWALAPLLAREMCSSRWRGAAVSALPLAHNAGVLLMYLAADARLPHRQVLWWCFGVSVVHCFVFFFMPESPSFLAAKGKAKEARIALAWLRGLSPEDPALAQEIATLPQPELHETSPFSLAKEMLRDRQRRRAFVIGGIAVVGQEACGVLAILQYAERVFVLARDGPPGGAGTPGGPGAPGDRAELTSPARHAVWLGAVQLVASAIALYLVERVGRRPLIVWGAVATGSALAVATWFAHTGAAVGGANGAAIALAVAVAADSAGLQPAPYSLLADMFHYEYRGCALMLVTAAACAGNALEVAVLPAAAAAGGLAAALALAAALTLLYALFAAIAVPETKGRSPEEIYEALCPTKKDVESPASKGDNKDENTKEKLQKYREICPEKNKDVENVDTKPQEGSKHDNSKEKAEVFNAICQKYTTNGNLQSTPNDSGVEQENKSDESKSNEGEYKQATGEEGKVTSVESDGVVNNKTLGTDCDMKVNTEECHKSQYTSL